MTTAVVRELAGPRARSLSAGAWATNPGGPALFLALCLLAPAVAGAQAPAEPAQATTSVCLPLEAHQAILADLRELRGDGSPGSGLRARVHLLDQKLELQIEQIRDLVLAKDLAVQAQTQAQQALEAAVRGKREAEESRDAWYRAPTLWFGTGVVGALVIAIAVDKIQE